MPIAVSITNSDARICIAHPSSVISFLNQPSFRKWYAISQEVLALAISIVRRRVHDINSLGALSYLQEQAAQYSNDSSRAYLEFSKK